MAETNMELARFQSLADSIETLSRVLSYNAIAGDKDLEKLILAKITQLLNLI